MVLWFCSNFTVTLSWKGVFVFALDCRDSYIHFEDDFIANVCLRWWSLHLLSAQLWLVEYIPVSQRWLLSYGWDKAKIYQGGMGAANTESPFE